MATGSVGASGSTQATTWQQQHPLRTQVNSRLNNQAARIMDGFESGRLSASQATQLLGEDQALRQQERGMASLNGSHITTAEQQALNQQLDAVSGQIYSANHGGQGV